MDVLFRMVTLEERARQIKDGFKGAIKKDDGEQEIHEQFLGTLLARFIWQLPNC